MSKGFINSKDLDKIAEILGAIHGISPEEFVVDMNKWLGSADPEKPDEFHIFPHIRNNSPQQKEKEKK